MKQKSKPARPKATIFDVAEHAGVSIKTVSRVVNKEPNVRQQTRDKVLESVGALRYQPNAAARELSGKRSRIIGLIYENAEEFSYLNDVFNGALGICEPAGFSLLLRPLTLPDPDIADRIRQFATNARVEGVVLPAPMGDLPGVAALLREMRIPFAAITPREADPDEINIHCNDEAASFSLTELLIEQGHRAIGFIKGHPDHGASAKRFAGYRRALKTHRIAYAPRLVRQGYFDFDSGRAATGRLLDLAAPPSAISRQQRRHGRRRDIRGQGAGARRAGRAFHRRFRRHALLHPHLAAPDHGAPADHPDGANRRRAADRQTQRPRPGSPQNDLRMRGRHPRLHGAPILILVLTLTAQ